MSRQAKGGLAAAVLVVVAGAGVWLLRGRDARQTISSSPAAPAPAFVTGPAASPALPSSPAPSSEENVQRVMEAWRGAILARDADTVLVCDRAFIGDARLFTPALVKSARTDGDERVRAFSTRVLGKYVDAALIPIFRQQLDDSSPFVRENAAWALGELAGPAGIAAGDLAKVMKHDRADAVRRAAGQALEKVRGGGKPRRGAG
jgi:hypothetical protein